MNVLFMTGMVTRDAQYVEDVHTGPRCHFILSPSIDRKAGDRTWWALCTVHGNIADDYVDRLWKGRMVTVRGAISHVAEERGEHAPLSVRVKEVVFHEDEAAQ